ncbi:MAG: hypothetical protein KBT39_00695 [Bacteroidales bacterium]|nr:hypothetical protein [Bacteroidales bacterium]
MKTKSKLQAAFYALMMVISIGIFTSCDEDDKKAYKMDGDWYGDFGMYYYTNRGQRFDSYDTRMQFVQSSPWSNHGYGTQVDWYKYGPYEFIYHQFRWEVHNGTIFINYKWESEWNCQIHDYNLTWNNFYGYFGDSNEKFTLYKLYDYDFQPYYAHDYGWGYFTTYPGYNPYPYQPYYAPGINGKNKQTATIDSTKVDIVMRDGQPIAYPKTSEIHFGNRFEDKAKGIEAPEQKDME